MGGVVEASVFLGAVLAYLWFLVIPLPWIGVILLAAVAYSWKRRGLNLTTLGLGWGDLIASFKAWRILWIAAALAFVALGYPVLFHWSALERGAVYLAWSAAQQVVYQSMTYMPLRQRLGRVAPAACLAGLAFALVHAPNPVLVPATLAWGIVSSLLFERCRSLWGLALMQVLLSSMLMWVTPGELHHGFRIGPYYYLDSAGTFAPPIGISRLWR